MSLLPLEPNPFRPENQSPVPPAVIIDRIRASDEIKDSFAYSFNEEAYHGNFDSREAAMAEAFAEDEDAQTVWTGRRVTPDRTPDADWLIDQVACNTTDEAGDWADDYLSGVSKEAKEEMQTELQALWDRWEKKHGLEPTWFNVEGVVEHSRENAPAVPRADGTSSTDNETR